MMEETIEELVIKIKDTESKLLTLKRTLESLSDGFDYAVVEYGYHYKHVYTNLPSALNHAYRYYGDNGSAYIYTNNKNANNCLSGGNIYYLENPKSVQPSEHPKEAINISIQN